MNPIIEYRKLLSIISSISGVPVSDADAEIARWATESEYYDEWEKLVRNGKIVESAKLYLKCYVEDNLYNKENDNTNTNQNSLESYLESEPSGGIFDLI